MFCTYCRSEIKKGVGFVLIIILLLTLFPVANQSDSVAYGKSTKVVKAKSITLSKSIYTIKKGGKVNLKATIKPINSTQKSITWKSSNKKTATVSEKGLVKGKKNGTVTITATIIGTKIKAKCKIIVGTPVSKVSVKSGSISVEKGKTAKITATVTPKKATTKSVTYKSANKNIATVTNNGVIKGIKAGSTKITVTAKDGTDKKAKVTVTVKNPVTTTIAVKSVTLPSDIVSIDLGASNTLKPTISPSNATNRNLEYVSDNAATVKVNAAGVITGLKIGSATITISSKSNPNIKCSVKVRVQSTTTDTQTYSESTKNSGEYFGKAAPGDYYVDADKMIERMYERMGDIPEMIPSGLNIFDVRDYGAVANDEILSTAAFNAAITAAYNYKGTGNKIVLVTGGDYRCSTINLKTGITLYITPDSSILGSRNASRSSQIIKADGQSNITITGGGTIWGDGEYFFGFPNENTVDVLAGKELPWQTPILIADAPDFINIQTLRLHYRAAIRGLKLQNATDGWATRPAGLLGFYNCMNITVENIIMGSSPNWTFTIENTDGVRVNNIVMNNNRHIPNADGIDICGSKNIKITNSFISTADDGIVIKAFPYNTYNVENVQINNCEVMSVMNCFKIGTETYKDVANVTVEDCKFFLSDIYPGACSGISIESADGSKVTNIVCRNIEMDNVSCPLYIGLNNRNRYKTDSSATINKDWAGEIDGITIENITATNAEVPSIITGASNAVTDDTDADSSNWTVSAATKWVIVKNVIVKNFNVTYRESTQTLSSRMAEENTLSGNATLDSVTGAKLYPTAAEYPENNRHGDVPAYGLYIRHVDGITIEGDFHVTPRTVDTRDCIYIEGNYANVELNGNEGVYGN